MQGADDGAEPRDRFAAALGPGRADGLGGPHPAAARRSGRPVLWWLDTVSDRPGETTDAPFGHDPGWRRPCPRLLRMRRAELAAGTGAVLVGAALAAVWAAPWLAGAIALLGVGSAAAVWGYLGRRFRGWGYLERDDDLLVRRGVMFRRLSVVPYGRMQFVEVTAGPLERSFGLATVRLHTAAAATDARIPGLAGDDAAALRDRLARLGEAHAEGL